MTSNFEISPVSNTLQRISNLRDLCKKWLKKSRIEPRKLNMGERITLVTVRELKKKNS